MTTITVSASREYAVKIGEKLLHALGAEAAAVVPGRTAAIISDSNVWPIYGEMAVKSLAEAGYRVETFVFPAGEASKNGETYLQILNFLAEKQITRSDCLIALGGGVVGDLAGFAASSYLRGIAYIQVPTTLLAMVDSSVGGKTTLNLSAGKNLAGAFYQPSLVLCDTDTLTTLPENVFTEGCAEVIKYSILFDKALFSYLEKTGPAFCRERVISQCIEWKRNTVMQDEFDTGYRRMLNLGHTIGHSIERASDYAISHGAAVAIGMSIVSRSAVSLGICNQADCVRIIALLKQFGLPTATDFSVDALAEHAMTDKKRTGNTIALVLPATIGCCTLQELSVNDLKNFVKAGM